MLLDLGCTEPIEVGYVCLSAGGAGGSRGDLHQVAAWTEEDYQSAEEAAADVVRAVRVETFWPPAEPPRFDDGYGWLCGDMLASRYRRFGTG